MLTEGGREAMRWWYFSVLEHILHVSKIDSHKSHQAVGESSKNSGNFTLDMSLVAIVEGRRRSPVLRLGAESFHATSYLKQSQTNTDKFIDKVTIFIVTLGTPPFLIGQTRSRQGRG